MVTTVGVYRLLKVVAFITHGTGKQLQDRRIDVTRLLEIQLKPHERFFIPYYHV